MIRFLSLLVLASPALAAPKIDSLSAKVSGSTPEVEIAVSVTKSGGNCDARVEFGDGKGRSVDFGLATTRTLKYTYSKGGSYKVTARGAGKAPCEGEKEVTLSVKGAVEKKKAETKKADKKSASSKKTEVKP